MGLYLLLSCFYGGRPSALVYAVPLTYNLIDYGGISGPRLETLEQRLRDDVLVELNKFGGKCVLPTV